MRTEEPVAGYDYWDEHPLYKVVDWQHEVGEENTRMGYWDWVRWMVEENGDGNPDDFCACGHPRADHSFGTPQGCGHWNEDGPCDCQEWNPA